MVLITDVINLCSFSTVHKQILKKHITEIHFERSYVECSECELILSKYSLRTHKQRFHTRNPKVYICENCPFDFKTIHPNVFKEHKKNHEKGFVRDPRTGTKLVNNDGLHYECNKCNIKYAKKEFLRRHIQAKHEDTWKAMHECSQCDIKFVSTKSFESHMKSTHSSDKTQYKCQQSDDIIY